MENSKNKSKMKKYIIMGICTMLVVLTSIVWYLKFQKASDEDKDMKPCNAIYYWKTQFQLNNYEKSFIEKHDIRKIYPKIRNYHPIHD